MIGVFDSGDGGLCTVERIRAASPLIDVCFLADKKNAPYGTKTRGEIISITKKNIKILSDMGAEKVLIACCTASSVYTALTESEKRIAVPIIDATARDAVKKTKSGKIGVIATRATVLSGAFEKSVRQVLPSAEVFSEEAQDLVTIIENGVNDKNISHRARVAVEKILSGIKRHDFDVVILGCTHFPRLEGTISEILGCETVSSASSGAAEILSIADTRGSGRTVFL